MVECELKIIKKSDMMRISTDDKYDFINEEYFKIPNELIKTIFNFFATKYMIFEFSELSYSNTKKAINGKTIMLKQNTTKKLLNRILKGVTNYVVFKEFELEKLDSEYIEELYMIGDNSEEIAFKKLLLMEASSIEELNEKSTEIFPFAMTIFDSSNISIYCKNTSYLELLFNNLIQIENKYNIIVSDN